MYTFSTYKVPSGTKFDGETITRHMASDGVISACGDTREDAKQALDTALIVRWSRR